MNEPGFTIRDLATREEFQSCVTLQQEIWGQSFADLVPVPVLQVAQGCGGIVAGAFDDQNQLSAFVFGVSGIEDGVLVHWSDMMAVKARYRDRGLGGRLKRYQRDQLLERGAERVYWTFDPLESRNAYINFAHLGTISREYIRDFYGESDSPLHRGIGTDRLIATWEIGSKRVSERLDGRQPRLRPEDIHCLPLANALFVEDGVIRSREPDLSIDALRLRIAIPTDIQKLKDTVPAVALEWRQATRAAFEQYMPSGYTVMEVVRRKDCGEYVLHRSA